MKVVISKINEFVFSNGKSIKVEPGASVCTLVRNLQLKNAWLHGSELAVKLEVIPKNRRLFISHAQT